MKFKCKITAEALEKTMLCGFDNKPITTNCLFAYIYNQLIPNVLVSCDEIHFFKTLNFKKNKREVNYKTSVLITSIQTPEELKNSIILFDVAKHIDDRVFNFINKEYKLEIPDMVIDYYFDSHIQVAQKLIDNKILWPMFLTEDSTGSMK